MFVSKRLQPKRIFLKCGEEAQNNVAPIIEEAQAAEKKTKKNKENIKLKNNESEQYDERTGNNQ